MAKVTHDSTMFHLEWVNPATDEVSYAKGSHDAFYWERGFDGDVLCWPFRYMVEVFAKARVGVPYRIGSKRDG